MTSAPSWLSVRLLVAGLVVVLASCLVLAGIVVGTKSVRAARERRRHRHLDPHRGALLELATGEGGQQLVEELDRVEDASWPTVQGYVLTLLGKVKGDPAWDLVQVLARHGAQPKARQDATSRRAGRRGRAALVLGRCGGTEDVPLLVGLLSDADPLVRQAAAVSLGQLGAPSAAPALLSAARHQHGAPGIPAGVAVDALLGLDFGIEDALRAGLRDEDPGVRTVAAEAVAGRSSVLSREAVRGALVREGDPTVEAALCRALGAVGDDRDVPVLAHTARHGSSPCRAAAVSALGAVGSTSSVAVLAQLCLADDAAAALSAAHTLASMHHPAARRALEQSAGQGSRAAHDELEVARLRHAPRGLTAVPQPRAGVRGA